MRFVVRGVISQGLCYYHPVERLFSLLSSLNFRPSLSKIESLRQNHRGEIPTTLQVRQWQTRLYDQLGNAVNHNPNKLLRTQV